MKAWTIDGADGEPILGATHLPDGPPAGVILIAHGFKGYKDYGMFPRIASTMAQRGLVAHRFNFSHSGMTNEIETFARPDLFEKDTWNRQVFDLNAVIDAVAEGRLDGGGLPFLLFGHSRGGVTVLLTAGRAAGTGRPQPAGVVTVAAPCTCHILNAEQTDELLEKGWLVSPSARTGQDLRIGKVMLTEMQDDPQGHDLLALAARIECRVLVAHGEKDSSVPVACAQVLAGACGDAIVRIVPDADHVFNTPNPMPPDAEPSVQLRVLLDAVAEFSAGIAVGTGSP